MGMLQKLGGRKFLMALAVVGAAIFLEMRNDKGLTPTMAGFLVAVIGTFSAANFANTAKHLASGEDEGLHDKIDTLQATVAGAYNKESEAALVGILSRIDTNMGIIKDTTAQVGSGLVGLHNIVSKR